MAKKAKVVKEKSIEDRIWDSANKLRGNLTASEYQNVVLGLVFLKYNSLLVRCEQVGFLILSIR